MTAMTPDSPPEFYPHGDSTEGNSTSSNQVLPCILIPFMVRLAHHERKVKELMGRYTILVRE